MNYFIPALLLIIAYPLSASTFHGNVCISILISPWDRVQLSRPG
jgi:hypothetical protein